MSQATLTDALADLCRRAAAGPDDLPDGDLLGRFAATRDETAFAALVRRHGRLVWGAAVRRTGDFQTAEDVFQATFLALARRAARLHGRTSLSGWLYTVAVRLSRRAARRARPVSLEPVADGRPSPLDALSARELIATLDAELARLPKPLRLPVVLCCLDGLSRDEAALRLGCSFGSLKGRLERGRELLRRRLTARGVSLSVVLGGLVVVPAAVPPELAAGTVSAILHGTPRPAAAALAGSLSSGRLAGILSAATVALVGIGLALMPGGSPPAKESAPPAKEKEVEPAEPSETIAIRVVADGKPVAGATVWASFTVPVFGSVPEPKPVTTGPDGIAHAPCANGVSLGSRVFARGPDGRIGQSMFNMYSTPGTGTTTIRLLAVGELTGRFRAADGKPIPAVELRVVQCDRLEPSTDNDRQPATIFIPTWLRTEYTVRTDVDGRFRVRGVPIGYLAHAEVTTTGFGQGYLTAQVGRSADVTLQRAGAIRVRLTGPADAAGTKGVGFQMHVPATPAQGPQFFRNVRGVLDGSAEVRIPNVCPGRYKVFIYASAQYPVRVKPAAEVVVTSGETVDLAAAVEPLARMTGRVVDGDSHKGIAKAPLVVQVKNTEGKTSVYNGIVTTDAEGRFVGYGPAGDWASLLVHEAAPGYAPPTAEALKAVDSTKLQAGKTTELADLILRRAATLRAVVLDEAGKPVPAAAVRTARLDAAFRDPEVLTGKTDGTVAVPGLPPDGTIALRVRKGEAVNVPEPVELEKVDGPVPIRISEKNACRLRGRVTDAAGHPLAGANVVVMWHYYGFGRRATMSTSRGVEALTTDADGRFTSGGLWPKDRYQVVVTHDEYSKAESKLLEGEAGQVHDVGTIALVASGKTVRGRVVGTDGKPLAGVTVLQRGDGPVGSAATTKPDGTFALGGFFDRPGFAIVRGDGYRPTAVPVRPGGGPITVTLRKMSEPPAPTPMDGHDEALTKFTRALAEKLWADREHLGGYERNVFNDMAHLDPATAKRWRDDEKRRTNGKVDLTKVLDDAELDRTLPELARTDIEEALARIPKTGQRSVMRILTLGEQLVPTDKAKALPAAEEAATRARALDPAERPWPLARAGDLAVRAGNAAGKKLLAEAVDLATKLPDGDRNRYYRGLVAASVVDHDEPAALKLIETIDDAGAYSRALAGMIGRLAETDPKRAEALFTKMRPGLGFSSSVARLVVGFRLAAVDPDHAEAVINDTPEAMHRILGLARLATLVAPKDRKRAWRLIDRAMELADGNPESLRSWSNYGGAAAVAAVVAARARQVGHPDVSALVARALALRASQTWDRQKDRDDQAIRLATALSFADPPTARQLLAGIAPPEEFAKRATGEWREWLFAAALADPGHAGLVVDAVWAAAKDRRGSGEATSNTGLIELLSILTRPGDRLTELGKYGNIPTVPDRPD